MTRYIAALLLLLCSSSYAAPIRWELRDAAFADGKTVTGFVDFDALAGDWGELLGYDLLWSTGREVFSNTVMPGSINLTLDNLQLSFSQHQWVKVADSLSISTSDVRVDPPIGYRVQLYSGGMCGGCGSMELIPPPIPNAWYFLDNAMSGALEATAYPYGVAPSLIPEPDTALVMLLPLIGLMLIDFKRDRRQPSALRLP